MSHPFPVERTCPFAPPPQYAAYREEAPLVRAQLPGGEVWLVTRHAEAQQVLSDAGVSTSSSTPGNAGIALRADPPSPEEIAMRVESTPGMFIDMDPPEHGRYRRLLIPEFSVRRVRDMRPGIQKIADDLIDEMLAKGNEAELVEAFGLALPSLVICRLLGVPYADHEFFQSRTRTMVSAGTNEELGMRAAMEIRAYLDTLVAQAAENPGDDLLGRLVTEGAVSHEEIAGMMFLMLVAGHETTASMLPLSVLTLLRHPEQLRRLREDPDLWPKAVEELLRYHSVVDWVAFDRAATRDMVIGGQQVKAGEGLFVLGAAANRDERAFERPDELDVTREGRHHLAFGYGVHQCLGQNLARAELEIALRTLFTRIPGLRVVGEDDELSFKYGAAIFGLNALPVAW